MPILDELNSFLLRERIAKWLKENEGRAAS